MSELDPSDGREGSGEPVVPSALAEGLRSLYGASVEVPRSVDEAVLAKLGRRAGHDGHDRRRAARRRVVRTVFAGGLLAAALGLAVVVWPGLVGRGLGPAGAPPASRSASAAPGPAWQSRARANLASGTLDMLDAFALARAVRDGARVDSSLDLTGDGTIDSRDVDALAARAVSVGASRGVMAPPSGMSEISMGASPRHSDGAFVLVTSGGDAAPFGSSAQGSQTPPPRRGGPANQPSSTGSAMVASRPSAPPVATSRCPVGAESTISRGRLVSVASPLDVSHAIALRGGRS